MSDPEFVFLNRSGSGSILLAGASLTINVLIAVFSSFINFFKSGYPYNNGVLGYTVG